MNIQLQICGIIMLAILLLIIIREKSLDLSSRRMYLLTLCLCMACLVMDILSVVAIVNAVQGLFPHTSTLVICKLYLLLLILQGYAGFNYASAEFFASGTHVLMRKIYLILFIAGCVAIAALPIEYYNEGDIVYTYGPSASATYALAFILLVSTIMIAIVSKGGTSKRRRRCIIIWQGAWICAAILQFLRPDFLIVGFGAAFGLVIVFAELENPHEGIDRITGQFTSNALYVYMRDLYRQNKTFSAMYINVDYNAGDFDLELEKAAMIRIANFLDSDKKTYVFHQSDNNFTVIYENEEKMQAGYKRAAEKINETVGLPIFFSYTLIPDSSIFKTADEFQQFQHYSDTRAHVGESMLVKESEVKEMRDYLKIRDTISFALANDRVEVFYQPIYSLKENRFTSAEALVRIRDEEGTLVMPGSFIPIAEENGLIITLGMEVLRQVCEFLSSGRPQELGIEYIDVNLSMAQFEHDNPASFVQQTISRYNIKPKQIILEITETADAARRQIILKNMDALISNGVRFALDDFGTGRSNLDYFVSMPVNMIKFDYFFTHWYFENEKARQVIEGTVGIIQKMGLSIVAEGVETEEQLNAMRDLGIEYIQGFFFSKPIPQDEFLEFLEKSLTA